MNRYTPESLQPRYFKTTLTTPAVQTVHQAVDTILQKPSLFPCMCRTCLQSIFLTLLTIDPADEFRTLLFAMAQRQDYELLPLMQSVYTQNLSNEDLANFSGKSFSAFNIAFRKTFAAPPRNGCWLNAWNKSIF